ncbi:MAG TPA: TolC family protein [Gemmatimonadaceae bacterium]|nr:TolC family protein [Gemmatimonadaceae bacterium]
MNFRTTRTIVRAAATILVAAAPAVAARAQDTTTAAAAPRPLSLGDAARLAARQGAIAEAARYRADEATARVRQARSALLPNLEAVANDGKRTFNTASFGLPLPGFDPNGEVIGPVRTIDFRGRAAVPLVDVGALGRVKAARTTARSANADAANSAELAAQNASAAYLRALRTEEIVRARTADSSLAADLLGIAQDQLKAGVGVGLDVTRAEAQVAATHAQLIAARNDRDRARLDLQRAVGLPLESPVVLTDSLGGLAFAAPQLPDEAAAIAKALRTRPDLRAAEEQLQAARQQVSATRAERLPSVGVFADDGLTGASYNHLLGTYTYGLQVSLPVFEGFRREGRIEEQSAVVRELDVRSRDLRQQAAIEVRGALLDLASTREQVEATRERLRLAEQELAQARDRFRAGVAGNADIISASLALNSSRNLVIDALTAYQNARVSFARATGSVTELP